MACFVRRLLTSADILRRCSTRAASCSDVAGMINGAREIVVIIGDERRRIKMQIDGAHRLSLSFREARDVPCRRERHSRARNICESMSWHHRARR